MGDVEFVWDDTALDHIEAIPQVAAVLDRAQGEAVLTMKRLAPVSPVDQYHRSGTLRSSIHGFRRDGNRCVGPTADYAPYVEDDTVPHIIESHGDYPLRNRATGQVFGRIVHHPGTRGQHFVSRTAETFQGRRYDV